MSEITCKNVFFSYEATKPSLCDVSFEIKKNSFVGIVGPNGGGKTTLIKLLLGLLQAQSGSIEIVDHPQKAYVPQALQCDKTFPISVIDLVSCANNDREKAKDMLEKLDLPQDASFGSLSGGQAQKTLLARALIQEPDLLVLDEPTANIDPKTQDQIYKILSSLKKRTSILMVTHDLIAVKELTDQILCVSKSVKTMQSTDICQHFNLGIYP